MRILILTQWFDPEPTFKGLLFAKRLKHLGNEVRVITGYPNYPSGMLYPGYRQKLITKENIDGIEIVRVPLFVSHDSSAIRRILNYGTFGLTSCIYGLLQSARFDIIYVYHPPITTGLSGAVISLIRRIPFVLDIQDLWPDTLRATGMINNKSILKIIGMLCKSIYRRASHIVVLSPGFKSALMKRGVPSEKLSIIYNWCDETALNAPQDSSDDLSFMDQSFNIVFAGNMGRAQSLKTVIYAAEILSTTAPSAQFVLVGDGIEVDALKELKRSLALKNVRFVSRLPMAAIGSVLSRSDCLLVHLSNDPLFAITIPSKTQAYMAVGKPILMAVQGDAAELIVDADAGFAVIPEDPQSLASSVIALMSMTADERAEMGRRASKFYQNEMSLEIGSGRFLSIFNNLLST